MPEIWPWQERKKLGHLLNLGSQLNYHTLVKIHLMKKILRQRCQSGALSQSFSLKTLSSSSHIYLKFQRSTSNHWRPIHSSAEILWVWPAALGHWSLAFSVSSWHSLLFIVLSPSPDAYFMWKNDVVSFTMGVQKALLNIALMGKSLLYLRLDRSNLLGSV